MKNFIQDLYHSASTFISQAGPLVAFISFLVGIAGLAFAVWAFFRKRQLGQISFYPGLSLNLFDAMVQRIPHLEVSYKRIPIKQNMILFKGVLENSSKIDIDQSMVKKELTITLSEGLIWREAAVKSPFSDKIYAKIVSDNEIQIHFDLFKNEEFFQLECLIEMPPNKLGYSGFIFQKNLTFNGRIKDISNSVKTISGVVLFERRISPISFDHISTFIGSSTIILCTVLVTIKGLPIESPFLRSTTYLLTLSVFVAMIFVWAGIFADIAANTRMRKKQANMLKLLYDRDQPILSFWKILKQIYFKGWRSK